MRFSQNTEQENISVCFCSSAPHFPSPWYWARRISWEIEHKIAPSRYWSQRIIFGINYSYVLLWVLFSFFFSLPSRPLAFPIRALVSKAKILGNQELFIKSGNDINLTCTTSQVSSPPSFIYWYKGGRVVNYSQRGGINVSTDRMTKTSNLIISRASPADSGNYTCAPSNSGKFINLISQFMQKQTFVISLCFPSIRCGLRHGACNWWQHRRSGHEAWQQQRN